MRGATLSNNRRDYANRNYAEGNYAGHDYAERIVSRFVAAILSMNDTLVDGAERERMRRAVLDAGELLLRRIWDWHLGKAEE